MKPRPFIPILAMLAIISFGMVACAYNATPEAKTYDTLRQTQNYVTAYVRAFDEKVAQGGVSDEKQLEVNRAIVRLEKEIVAIAQTSKDGFAASTPEEINRLVANLTEILKPIVPPPTRNP